MGNRARWRGVGIGLAAVLALALAGHARGDEGMKASMECRLEAGSGRLLCTVALAAPAGRVLSWSDALVVSAPPAARPLKSRVASGSGRPDQIVIGFVVGSGDGGRIEVVARAVSCPAASRAGACTPERRTVSYDLKVPGAPG